MPTPKLSPVKSFSPLISGTLPTTSIPLCLGISHCACDGRLKAIATATQADKISFFFIKPTI